MFRFFLVFLFLIQISSIIAKSTENKHKNFCMEAINQYTSFKATGVYGNPFELEWNPSAAYVLLKEMKKFVVLEREFVREFAQWRFEFAEMTGSKTIVFVFHKKFLKDFCKGPNAFFVTRK